MRYLSLQNMRLHVAEVKLVGKPLLYVEVVKVCNATEHAVTTQKDLIIYLEPKSKTLKNTYNLDLKDYFPTKALYQPSSLRVSCGHHGILWWFCGQAMLPAQAAWSAQGATTNMF